MSILLVVFGLFFCGQSASDFSQPDNCWEGRETIKQLLNREGVIKRDSIQVSIILPSTRQLFPCNLPDSYQSGDSVLFSAEQKEIFPNERWEGRPIQLTHIELKEQSFY